jgi:hypothetical protein
MSVFDLIENGMAQKAKARPLAKKVRGPSAKQQRQRPPERQRPPDQADDSVDSTPYQQGYFDVPTTSPLFYTDRYLGEGAQGSYGFTPQRQEGMSYLAPSPRGRVDENIREGVAPRTQPIRQGNEFLRPEGFARGFSSALSGGPSIPDAQMPEGNRKFIEDETQSNFIEDETQLRLQAMRPTADLDTMLADTLQTRALRLQHLMQKQQSRGGLTAYEEQEVMALQAGLFTGQEAQ